MVVKFVATHVVSPLLTLVRLAVEFVGSFCRAASRQAAVL
jgi:hypothetical protein